MRDYHRRLILAAQKAGATEVRIDKSKTRHHRITFRAPDGSPQALPLSSTPSDRRTILNEFARIRRKITANKPSPGD